MILRCSAKWPIASRPNHSIVRSAWVQSRQAGGKLPLARRSASRQTIDHRTVIIISVLSADIAAHYVRMPQADLRQDYMIDGMISPIHRQMSIKPGSRFAMQGLVLGWSVSWFRYPVISIDNSSSGGALRSSVRWGLAPECSRVKQ